MKCYLIILLLVFRLPVTQRSGDGGAVDAV